MGNTKSMNRSEIEKAAATGKWDYPHHKSVDTILRGLVKQVQQQSTSSNKKKKQQKRASSSPAQQQQRLSTTKMDSSELDDIYDFVLSLKNDGKDGNELLQRFVQQQARRLSLSDELREECSKSLLSLNASVSGGGGGEEEEAADPPPPVRTIMIDASSSSSASAHHHHHHHHHRTTKRRAPAA